MTVSFHGAAGTKEAANLKVLTDSGLKGAARAFLRTATGLQQFFGKFSASASPSEVSGVRNSGSAATITTRATTVSVTGAVGALTFAWTQVSGDPMTITNPAGATTAFSASASPGDSFAGEFNCHVEDASGHSTDIPVSATIVNLYGGTA